MGGLCCQAYTISFRTKLKNLTHYFCYSAIPAHLAILCYIKKLTSYILLGSLLAAFFHTPIACHNIQSFKRKQIQKRQEQEKNLRTNIMTELYPCIFHNHDNKKLPSSDKSPVSMLPLPSTRRVK